ncbi:MAG: cell division protein ZapA [Tepidamorphaceae bacterium]|nr:cell division protein ZapA [Rhodobiaceae bacterium]MCC0048291.1 cell division protein ZapA [Rhodobiaceae bacterium]
MPEITVTIAGKPYRMACGEGEEQHLMALAADFDRRITALKQHFGEVGDNRLLIMAALTVADDLAEARRQTADAHKQIEQLQAAEQQVTQRTSEAEADLAERIESAAAVVERMVDMLTQPARAD